MGGGYGIVRHPGKRRSHESENHPRNGSNRVPGARRGDARCGPIIGTAAGDCRHGEPGERAAAAADPVRYARRYGVGGSNQDRGYVNVAQALEASVPGLYIASRNGPFDYVNISLQGSRTEDVLWLVDGIRVNNRLYAGTTPLDTIPASMIERIEVLDGGQALFYGTQAVAGAVNIVTKSFSDHPDGAFSLGADSENGRHLDGYFVTP